MVSASLAGDVRASDAAAGVTVIPAGVLDAIVTLPLKPFSGTNARVATPEPEGEIDSSAF